MYTKNLIDPGLNSLRGTFAKYKRDDKKHVELIVPFESKELSEDYKQAIIAMLKTMREGKQ